MKKTVAIMLLAGAATYLSGFSLTLASAGHSSHQEGNVAQASTKKIGEHVRTAEVDRGVWEYRVLESKQAAQKRSSHLMLFPNDKAGGNIRGAKAGFQVTSPDGTSQRVMALEMTDGYGADVDFTQKGVYEIKAKLAKDGTQAVDAFKFEVR